MDLIDFKAATDQCARDLEGLGGDVAAVLAYVGVQIDGDIDLAAASEAIDEVARGAFSAGKTDVWEHCRKLCHELVQRHVIEGEAVSPYLKVAEWVRDRNRDESTPPRGIEGDWGFAVRCAVAGRVIMALRGHPDSAEPKLTAYRASMEAAFAVKRFMAYGCAFERSGGNLRFEPASEARIVAEIDRRVESFGGLLLARNLFSVMGRTYDASQERHHLGRRTTPFGDGEPQVPIGYLLHLAAKHPVGREPARSSREDAAGLISMATDYAAVMEVQPYATQFFIGGDAVAMFQNLREIAIYDTLFCLPQLRPRDALAIAEGILDGVELPGPPGSAWTLKDALDVSRAIMDGAAGKTCPQWVDIEGVARRCSGMSTAKVFAVLVEALSHPLEGANQGLMNPTAAHGADGLGDPGIDFYRRPLLRLGPDRFVLFDRSMSAPAFIEALLAPAQKAIRNFDADHVGPAVERLLRKSFQSRGIATKSGKYVVAGEVGECDLVVETRDKVILFEVKKKALTGKARAGSDVFVILDLAKSVVKAQTQAAGHELRLRLGATLELVDEDGQTHRLCLDGRSVERVAVTLPDYGSFQDRQLLTGFLESHMSATYSVKAPQYQKEFAKLDAMLAEFRGVEDKLLAMQSDSEPLFHHCWFLSVPHLLILLDEATDAESFWDALSSTRSIVFGSMDFYWEHAHFKSMKERAAREAAQAPAVSKDTSTVDK